MNMADGGRPLLWAAGGIGALVAGRALWRLAHHYSFRDKTVLVTGGSRGLGLLIAHDLLHEGAQVAICARDYDELRRAAEMLREEGHEVLIIRCDLGEQDQVDQMIGMLARQWQRIDVLVNNAGMIQVAPLEEMALDDYEAAMRVHFWGPLYTIQAVLPHMRRRREGRIVNITSIGGKVSLPHLVPYCASKFALVGLSQGLRAELRKDGVLVTTVCPGLMRTGGPRHALFKGKNQAEYAWFSISDSLPMISIDAHRAARRIVRACRYGVAETMVSLPARLATMVHGLFPGVTADMLGLVNRALPGPGGVGQQAVKGSQSTSEWSPSSLTTLSDRAARRNNEIP